MFEQSLRVDLILIRLPVFPAAKQDSDPLVRQSTNCGVVTLAAPPEKFVMRFGPLAPATRMIGKFLERLSHEFRTRVSPMHETLLATLLGNGCDARQFLYFLSGLKPIPIRAERRRQARSQRCTRPGEAFKDGAIGMLAKNHCDLAIKLRNAGQQRPQLG